MNAHDIHVRPGLSGRIIQSRQTLYIPDTLDPQAMAAFQIIRSGGEPTRSYVGVPIILRDQVMGAISTQSYQPNAYTAEQVRLLETIATQAAVALENARLYEIAQQELAERTQAELALRDSRQLLQTVMDNIPQAVFWKDRNLVYLGCNRAFAADAGLASAQDIFGKTDWDMPWKEQAELYRADDTRVMDSGAPKLDYEEPQTTPDGSIIWLRTNKVPLRDADGNVTAVLGMYEDITDRKRLVQQIQEALERRGRQVQTSTEVAQEIAAAPALDELFNRVVTLVKERFGYYHAQILRYDPAQDAVVLVAGYGAAGRTMLAAGHKVVMGRGVVGTAAASGASVLASDVLQDQDWRPNPNLPDTQGELAVPIKLRDQVLGILDVQSDRVNALTLDDQLLLEGLCGQIAIAIQNTQLLQQTRHRVQVEALVSNISTSFVNVAVERVSDEINATLRKLGESNDIDRAYIFQFTPDGATMDNTHEWCAPGVSPYIDSLQHIPIDTFPMLLERIRQLDVFHAPRVADLPAAITERTEFEKEGIQSIICVPIVTRGTAIGFIGFDSVRQAKAWADEDILLLRLVGEIVAASLERRRTEEQQQETLRELERLYRATTREGWQTFRQTANLPAGYVFDRGALQPNEDVWFPEIEQALESNTLIEPSTPGAPTVAPLTVYGQVIGALGVMNDPRQRLTPDDTALIASVSEQVAQALESARLFEQTQSARQQAEASLRNVQVLQRLTGQISATLDMERVVDTLLQTLATELSFSYLAFNLIDDEARMMRTLRATGLAANLNGLVRPLDALQNDILMDVARRGQIEIIDGWDPRFDRELFEKSGHAELVRAYGRACVAADQHPTVLVRDGRRVARRRLGRLAGTIRVPRRRFPAPQRLALGCVGGVSEEARKFRAWPLIR